MLWFLGFFAFIGALVYGGFSLISRKDDEMVLSLKNLPRALAIVGASIFVWYILSSIIIIEAGDRGVIFNMFTGVKMDNVIGEGFHIVPAMINNVTHYDVYTKTWTEAIPCLSSDGLPIDMDVSIRYRLASESVAKVKRNVGDQNDVEQKILIPTARSKMRDVAAMFTAQEAYASKRIAVQSKYQELLTEFFKTEDYLISEQILVRKVTPPEDLTKKITETKVAEQDVLKQKNILESEKQVKEQTIVQAQAQAESLRIQAAAIAQNPKVIGLKFIEKWNGTLPVVMSSKDTGMLFNMSNFFNGGGVAEQK